MALKVLLRGWWWWIAVVAGGCATAPPGPATATAEAVPHVTPTVGTAPTVTGVVTFATVAAAVLERHPELVALDYELQARAGLVSQAGQWANPVASVAVEDVAGSGDLSGTDALETTVALSQELPLADQPARRMAVARQETTLVEWDQRERRLALLGQARTAFAEVAVAQDRLALARENERLVARLVEGVARRADAGDVSPVERTRAQVELSTATIARRQVELELVTARSRLAALWGAGAPAFEAVAPPPPPAALPSMADLLTALARLPQVQRWGAEEALREASLRLAEAEAWPEVEVAAGWRRFQESGDHAFLVELGVPLPIRNRNQGAIAAARATLAKTVAEREAAWRALYGEVQAIGAQLAAQQELIAELHRTLLPQAEATYEAAHTAYAGGQGGLIELLDAERALLATRQTLADAHHAFRLQQAALEALLGLSLSELSIPPVDTRKELR